MTKRKITYSVLILLLIGIVVWFNFPRKENIKDINIIHNKTLSASPKTQDSISEIQSTADNLSYIFSIEPEFEKNVNFKISGELEAFKWRKGDKFKKGDLLFLLDNRSSFHQISEAKKQLIIDLTENLKDLRDETFKQKWVAFSNEIKEDDLLPATPSFYASGYKEIQINNKVIDEINLIQTLETRVLDYFYVAPFDGEFVSLSSKSFQKVSPKTKIASICENSNFILKSKIQKDEANTFVNNKFFSIAGKDLTSKLKFNLQNKISNDSIIASAKVRRNILKGFKIGDKIKVSSKKINC